MKMKLVRLIHREVLEEKKVICIGRSMSYFKELQQQYCDILDRIIMILDNDVHDSDFLQFQKRKISIYPLQNLMQFDLSGSILLITSDYYREYYDSLVRLLGENSVIDEIYFYADKETAYDLSYRERYTDTPLEDILVFRSGPRADAYVDGMDFADNARALFEYALSIGLNKRYALIWIVKNPSRFRSYEHYQNVFFLPFEGSVSEDISVRDRYYRVMCLAKYFFFTDAYGFVRNCRSDQIRVQLWHGCGYKKRLNTVPCEKRYEYMTVTSSLYAAVHAAEFDLRMDQMLVTGCAKTDWLFEKNLELLKQLCIPQAEKYIFWFPTYRFSEQRMHKPVDGVLYKETGMPIVSSAVEFEAVNECLRKNKIVLVMKLHPFQDRKAVSVPLLSNIVLLENKVLVRHDIQPEQLLAIADAMISDYSSTAVSYLILDRPMAFCVEDADRYSKSRGYVFEPIFDWMPGIQIENVDGLMSFIHEIGRGQDTAGKKRAQLRGKMHQYCDQNSCRRILQSLGIV